MASEEMEVRERLATAEATLRAHGELLRGINDNVSGINASLHSLTRLEERAEAHREQQAAMQAYIADEIQNRKAQAESYGERLGAIEAVLNGIGVKTELNSKGRDIFEKWFPAGVALIAAPLISYFVATAMGGAA